MKAVKVLVVPRAAWGPSIAQFKPGLEPDPHLAGRILPGHRIDNSFIDPRDFPWNPFRGRDSLLQSVDPARSFRILLRERAADIIVAAGEGGALLPLLLRRALGFKAPIALWDIGLGDQWKPRQHILNAVIPRADAILVLSTSQKRYIEARWAPRGEVVVVGHMVDTEFFHPMDNRHSDQILSIGDDRGRDYST
ncbi:MAG: glycosyltransferase, partial [Candidatus Binataceae bacterium]